MTLREVRVAIDGPAGAGKSTVSRLVAERLGYVLLDTGALYRCIALAARERGVAWDDAPSMSELSHGIARRSGITFEHGRGGAPRILLDGKDVSAAIRTQDIAQGASKVSALPGVRDALLEMQRDAAHGGGVVLEGRDIGTVVLPDAEAKFFLTASVEVRAKRRYRELAARGETPDLADVTREIRERDERDTQRPVAPLRQAEDAILVESSGLDIEDVVDTIVRHVHQVRASRHPGAAPSS